MCVCLDACEQQHHQNKFEFCLLVWLGFLFTSALFSLFVAFKCPIGIYISRVQRDRKPRFYVMIAQKNIKCIHKFVFFPYNSASCTNERRKKIKKKKTKRNKQKKNTYTNVVVVVNTYFKNCGNIDVHPLRSCFKVRYNSNVDTVFGSNCNDAILLLTRTPQIH